MISESDVRQRLEQIATLIKVYRDDVLLIENHDALVAEWEEAVPLLLFGHMSSQEIETKREQLAAYRAGIVRRKDRALVEIDSLRLNMPVFSGLDETMISAFKEKFEDINSQTVLRGWVWQGAVPYRMPSLNPAFRVGDDVMFSSERLEYYALQVHEFSEILLERPSHGKIKRIKVHRFYAYDINDNTLFINPDLTRVVEDETVA